MCLLSIFKPCIAKLARFWAEQCSACLLRHGVRVRVKRKGIVLLPRRHYFERQQPESVRLLRRRVHDDGLRRPDAVRRLVLLIQIDAVAVNLALMTIAAVDEM